VNLQDTGGFFDLAADQYDAITLWHVLEHVHTLHEYMAQLKKLLKSKGRILIAVPNYTSGDALMMFPVISIISLPSPWKNWRRYMACN
jgi:2-polyprenyl-3-methyl-5-hydroxy-6-metoxy-1,4-benzoquinol methylase